MATPKSPFRALSRATQLLGSTSPAWKCTSCTHAGRTVPHRRLATTPQEASKKPYYITTPIFYVNAAPHVGHLYTMVLADILKRWQILLGNTDAQLLTGTDEHGMKVQKAATEARMDPQAFCDMNCQKFEALAKAANIDYDHFIRTTDPAHRDAVQYFWEMLNHRGYIYTAKHEGWYSVSDETFYPQSQVQNSLDPSTGRKRMVSVETGKEVQWSSETNYHFRLSLFQDRLLELYKREDPFIRPRNQVNNLIESVSSGLQDLSISRPVERLNWGIPVPGDETQIIYVWLDALVSYLTKAGYPFPPGQENQHLWPADVHVIGKDIVRFHCVYWPAFLMALDLPLPNVLAHGHWMMNRQKMSKSTGNVVNPFFAIDRFGVDTMRFFLAYQGAIGQSHTDYDNQIIIRTYKKRLQDGIGNLAHRSIGCAKGNLRWCIVDATRGNLPPATPMDEEHQLLLGHTPATVAHFMDCLTLRQALHQIMMVIEKTHKYFHAAQPWLQPDKSQRVIYNVIESVRICAILLQPFMPTKSRELLDILRVDKRTFSAAAYGSDPDYGEGTFIRKGSPLFPPLISEK